MIKFWFEFLTIILLAVEAIMIKKFKPKLNHQLGPDKGSRITLNVFK